MKTAILLMIVRCVCAEYDIPKELYPPGEMLERIGGFTPFLGYKNVPEHVFSSSIMKYVNSTQMRDFLQFNLKPMSKKLTCLLPSSSSKVCNVVSSNKFTPKFPQSRENETCEKVNGNSMSILVADSETGECVLKTKLKLDLHRNSTKACRISSINDGILPTLLHTYFNSSPTFCNCGQCRKLVLLEDKYGRKNVTNSVHGIYVKLITDNRQIIRVTARLTYAASNTCTTMFITQIRNVPFINSSSLRRYDLQRGRFHCPSEVTCLWEMFYVFTISDSLLQPSYLVTAVVVILSVYVAFSEEGFAYYLNKLSF